MFDGRNLRRASLPPPAANNDKCAVVIVLCYINSYDK